MEKFTVNGKEYYTQDLNFEFLVMLDKNDIKVTNILGLAAVNCFLAYCGRFDEKTASKEITEHIMNGGKLDELTEIYGKALEESGFFRALLGNDESEPETSGKDTTEAPATKKKKSATE
jgi:hypothetical protein